MVSLVEVLFEYDMSFLNIQLKPYLENIANVEYIPKYGVMLGTLFFVMSTLLNLFKRTVLVSINCL